MHPFWHPGRLSSMKTVDGPKGYNLHALRKLPQIGFVNPMLCPNLRPMRRLFSLSAVRGRHIALLATAVLLLLGCQFRGSNTPKSSPLPDLTRQAIATLSTNDILEHIKVLSSDEF